MSREQTPTNEQIQAAMLEGTKEVRATLTDPTECACLDADIARMERGAVDMGETGWAIMRAVTSRLADLAPTVSGGEGWEELERLEKAVRPAIDQLWDKPVRSDVTLAKMALSDALIAVARGGFSALQASPSVRRPLTPNVLELVGYVTWALENEQPINDEHIIALVDAIKDTRNPPLPTVQAETAVVGALRRARSFIDSCVEIGEFTPEGAENPCEIVEAIDAVLAPVSTGEQPGMSEGLLRKIAVAIDPDLDLSSFDDPYVAGSKVGRAMAKAESVAEVISVPRITLPDDLLSLSEAATQGEWGLEPEAFSSRLMILPADATGDQPAVGSILKREDAAFIKEAVNFIRTLAAKQGGKSSDRAPLAKDRWPDLTVAEVEAMRRDANSGAGYSMAFYEVAEMLGLPAMPKSPREAWEDDIKPLLRRRLRHGDQS